MIIAKRSPGPWAAQGGQAAEPGVQNSRRIEIQAFTWIASLDPFPEEVGHSARRSTSSVKLTLSNSTGAKYLPG